MYEINIAQFFWAHKRTLLRICIEGSIILGSPSAVQESVITDLYQLENANSLELFQISLNIYRIEFPTTRDAYSVSGAYKDWELVNKDRHRTTIFPCDDWKGRLKATAKDMNGTNVPALPGAPDSVYWI
jgi:hypothetical protein